MKRYIYFIILLSILALLSCQKEQTTDNDELILVNIDDKITISKNEFLRRAEYTIRPPYCKNNTYLHKKIILNSLIAEKLFALEAGDSNTLSLNNEFKRFIKGRKEQAMRQWMHHVEAGSKVRLDSTEIKKYYRNAGRNYQVAYFSIADTSALSKIKPMLANDADTFKDIYASLYGDTLLPKRKVSLGTADNLNILHALFSGEIKKDQVLAPIKTGHNEFLIMKVLGWTDEKVITNTQVNKRLDDISESLTRIKSSAIWQKRVAQIMKGKSIHFNPATFKKLEKIFFTLYFRTDEELKDSITERIWDMESDPLKVLNAQAEGELFDQSFFTIDGQTWFVNDFRNELMSHPLVFRKHQMPSHEFSQQFRLAVVDLIRDSYVTQEAYKQGYDQAPVVQRNENMWRDAMVAAYHKNKYLGSISDNVENKQSKLSVIGEHLNGYVDSLQTRYFKKIELNFDEFEKIALTSIDLHVKQKNMPYQSVVPNFPVLTTDHYIDYITRMK